MRSLRVFCSVATIAVILLNCLTRPETVAKIEFIIGSAEKLLKYGNRQLLEIEEKIHPGEGFATGKNSFVDISLNNAKARLLENSQLLAGNSISLNPYLLEKSIRKLEIKKGTVLINVRYVENSMPLAVFSENIAGYAKGARFSVTKDENTVLIRVFEGSVLVYRLLPELAEISEKIYRFAPGLQEIRDYNNTGVIITKQQMLEVPVGKTIVQNEKLKDLHKSATQILNYRKGLDNQENLLELTWHLAKSHQVSDVSRFVKFFENLNVEKTRFSNKEKALFTGFTDNANLSVETHRIETFMKNKKVSRD